MQRLEVKPMLYLPPSQGDSPTLSGWRWVVVRLSQPVMFLILVLCYLWLATWPKKRPQLQRFRAQVPDQCPLIVCVFLLASVVLERWPLFVVCILGAGSLIGLILAGVDGLVWGLGSSIVGASLAPVLADEVPARFFRGGRK